MEVIPLTLANLELVRKLHYEIYGWAKSKEKFESMYVDCRGNLKAIGYIAKTDAGEAAAYYGVFLCDVNINGKNFFASQSGDTMTHPHYQGQGWFTQLALKTYERARELGVSIVYGFPNENSYPGFKKKLGWNFPFKMNKATKIVPCLPFGLGGNLARIIDGKILSFLGFKGVADDAFMGVDEMRLPLFANFPDRKFDNKKYYLYEEGEAAALIKLEKLKIYIGYMRAESSADLDALIKKISMAAFLTGRPVLITFLSCSCAEFGFLSSKFKLSESLWFGYTQLDEDLSDFLDVSQIRYVDYDTF